MLQRWAHCNQPLKQHPLLPQGFPQQAPTTSSASLWDTECTSAGLITKSNYFAPRGKPSKSRASPPPVRGTGRLSAVAERGQPVRDSSSKPNSSHRKTLLPGTVFWPRFFPGLLFGHGFLQTVQGRVRFVGRAMARNRITIFKLFLLQPDAGRPFFPDGQPLLPKA